MKEFLKVKAERERAAREKEKMKIQEEIKQRA